MVYWTIPVTQIVLRRIIGWPVTDDLGSIWAGAVLQGLMYQRVRDRGRSLQPSVRIAVIRGLWRDRGRALQPSIRIDIRAPRIRDRVVDRSTWTSGQYYLMFLWIVILHNHLVTARGHFSSRVLQPCSKLVFTFKHGVHWFSMHIDS
jgi:hypothetical protein